MWCCCICSRDYILLGNGENMTEKELITCKYCGKENTSKKHENMCGSNPDNPRNKRKDLAVNPVVVDNAPSTPQGEPYPLIITDVQKYLHNEVAWYQTKEGQNSKRVNNIGLLHTDKGECLPCALIMTSGGILVPAFMVDGFVGMYKEGISIPAVNDDEPFPPYPEETNDITTLTPIKDHEPIEQPKKGLLSRLFGKDHELSKPTEDTQSIIKEAINASG